MVMLAKQRGYAKPDVTGSGYGNPDVFKVCHNDIVIFFFCMLGIIV